MMRQEEKDKLRAALTEFGAAVVGGYCFEREADWLTDAIVELVETRERERHITQGTESEGALMRRKDPYAGIDQLLQWLIAETESLIEKAESDPQQASAIAREVYRRIGIAGQIVMEHCLIDARTLEERLQWESNRRRG